jgi:hypothetical protein
VRVDDRLAAENDADTTLRRLEAGRTRVVPDGFGHKAHRACRRYAGAVADWATVREIASGFPEVEQSLEVRASWRVRGKLFAWEARERDGGGLAIRVDGDEKQLILDSDPDVYFTSPHYSGYPGVQIRLERISHEDLRQRLEDAWLIQAPKRLAAEYVVRADD